MAAPPPGTFAQLAALYRAVLRVNRNVLPSPLRVLGDSYVSEEFRRHLKGKTTPAQWQEFARAWRSYTDMLTSSAGAQQQQREQRSGNLEDGDLEVALQRSGNLEDGVLRAMSPEQREQLARLQDAAVELSRGGGVAGGGEQQQLDSRPLG